MHMQTKQRGEQKVANQLRRSSVTVADQYWLLYLSFDRQLFVIFMGASVAYCILFLVKIHIVEFYVSTRWVSGFEIIFCLMLSVDKFMLLRKNYICLNKKFKYPIRTFQKNEMKQKDKGCEVGFLQYANLNQINNNTTISLGIFAKILH